MLKERGKKREQAKEGASALPTSLEKERVDESTTFSDPQGKRGAVQNLKSVSSLR